MECQEKNSTGASEDDKDAQQAARDEAQRDVNREAERESEMELLHQISVRLSYLNLLTWSKDHSSKVWKIWIGN